MLDQLSKKYKEICKNREKVFAPFLLLYYLLHRGAEVAFMRMIRSRFPINDHQIILRSFPDYSDNARALADYLVENGYDREYDIYFDVADLNSWKDKGAGIRFISCETDLGLYRFKWLRLICTAKYFMFTHRPILIRKRARDEQVLINLFHGNGYKEKSIQQGKTRAPYDYSIVSGDLFIKPMAHFWDIEEDRVLPIGFPRYNWLLSADESAAEMLESYKKNPDSKVVIWMPTYRSDKKGVYNETESISQFPLVDTPERWKELDDTCREKNIVLLIKLHPFQKDYIIPFGCMDNIKEISDGDFCKADIPMYKFIAHTHALISDYSSIAVDYLLVNRPMAFALEDFDAYNDSRGFVFEDPREYMPGHHLYSFKDLECFLKDVSADNDLYKEARREMRTVAIFPSEDYCKGLLERFGIALRREGPVD